MRDGKQLVTGGPIAEICEQLGVFFLIEAKDLNEAITIAGQIPGREWAQSKSARIWRCSASRRIVVYKGKGRLNEEKVQAIFLPPDRNRNFILKTLLNPPL